MKFQKKCWGKGFPCFALARIMLTRGGEMAVVLHDFFLYRFRWSAIFFGTDPGKPLSLYIIIIEYLSGVINFYVLTFSSIFTFFVFFLRFFLNSNSA